MENINLQIKPQYTNYLQGHKLNDQKKSKAIQIGLTIVGGILIYLGFEDGKVDTFSIIAGGFFVIYGILLRPLVFNYKIKRGWTEKFAGTDLRPDSYSFDDAGVQIKGNSDTIQLKWADFKDCRRDEKVLNLYFKNSINWITIPLSGLKEETKQALLNLVDKKCKRMPTQ